MRRVEGASGAKYSTHNEKPRKFEAIAPVGTNYTPIGKPDIAAMRRVPPPPSSASSTPKPSIPTAPRPVFGAPVSAPVKTAPPSNVPDDDWGDEPPAPPPPPSRPPAVPSAPRPAPTSVSIGSWYCVLPNLTLFSCKSYTPAPRAVPSAPALVTSSNVPTKPAGDDRIAPVVSLVKTSETKSLKLSSQGNCIYTHQADTRQIKESIPTV